jgi:hypothetical protein
MDYGETSSVFRTVVASRSFTQAAFFARCRGTLHVQ